MENPHSQHPSGEYNLRGYINIFITQQISIFGSAIVQFALIWWLSSQYSESIVLSVATMMGILPLILISPFAGVFADRWSRKKILVGSDSLQALATLALIILFKLGVAQLYHIYILLAIRGLVQGIQIPASYSVMSAMVPPKKIRQMNSINSVVQSLLSIASPALGAIAVGRFSIENIFWLDIFSFIPAALVLVLVFIPRVKPTTGGKSSKIHVFKEIRESLSYVKSSHLGTFVLLFALLNIFINPMFSLLPKLVSNYYKAGVSAYSNILIGFQAGYLLSAGLMVRAKHVVPKITPILRYSLLISILTSLIFFVKATGLWVSVVLASGIGFLIALIEVQFTSILQIVIPKNMQGRVFSNYFLVIKSILPLSLLWWGYFADLINVHIIYLISPGIAAMIILIINFTAKTGSIEALIEKIVLQDSEIAVKSEPSADSELSVPERSEKERDSLDNVPSEQSKTEQATPHELAPPPEGPISA